MEVSEIQVAVSSGLVVCWKSPEYQVVRSEVDGRFFIKCLPNGHCIGLTWADGVTLNGNPDDFYCVLPHSWD